ncbi:MAG: hypothetical protein Kow0032_28150 [Methyloligellaceae bacterium]
MSFALEYRKKMQAKARKAQRSAKTGAQSDEGFAVPPAGKNADTRGNRRRVLAALSLAALILSVFNSGALVTYTGGLAGSPLGLRVAIASEDWHALMEKSRMTGVVESIRGAVATVRHSSWQDLAVLVAPSGGAPDEGDPGSPGAVPGPAPVLPAGDGERGRDLPGPIEVERGTQPLLKAEISR